MAGRAVWCKPSATDVTVLMSSIVQGAVSKDPGGVNRATNALGLIVERVTSAIRNGNRTPLSLTQGTVPPGARMHCVVLAVNLMVSSTPNMSFVAKESWQEQVKEAKEWLKDVYNGKIPVDYPVDPDQTTLRLGGQALWGSDTPVDMTTDGELADYYVAQTTPSVNPAQNLIAVAGAKCVQLMWDPPSNPPETPVQYTVMQGTVSGGEQTQLIAGLMGTEWLDNTVTSGTQYFYIVIAVNIAGASVASNEAFATPN